jgi:hypothetical protein
LEESFFSETENFGKGHYFRPGAILPVEAGSKLRRTLEALEEKHDKEYTELRQRHFDEVKAAVEGLLPFNKGKK